MTIRFYKNSAENPNYLPSVNSLYGGTSGSICPYSFSHMSLQLIPITPNNNTGVLITL